MIHPLLSALPENTNSEEFVKNLGFEVDYYFEASGELGENASLDSWTVEIPEGFKLAGKWEADSGSDDYFVACFLKPTTPLATALWLIGLGQMTQDQHPKTHWSYYDIHETDYAKYVGQYESPAAAEAAAVNAGIPSSEVETELFLTPLASTYINADNVLEAMREATDPLLPDQDYPCIMQPNSDLLDSTLKLLIDGWAKHTGNEPTFGVET